MITAKHARQMALDAYTLSSLFVRRVLLTKPATLAAYREKTRELLLHQSRLPSSASSTASPSPITNTIKPNLAAVKVLEWEKEWNLMRYYGLQEYGRRLWSSRISSNDAKNNTGGDSSGAQIAFMITSEQRQVLSNELGYSAEDIRSFKPIEALLLVKNSVKKESDEPTYDFRTKLRELVDEKDRLMKAEHERARQKVAENVYFDRDDVSSNNLNNIRSLSPEDAERAHAKPDVAMALMSAQIGEQENLSQSELNEFKMDEENHSEASKKGEHVETSIVPSTSDAALISSPVTTTLEPVVTPCDSEQLHMKPDVAAAFIGAQQEKQIEQQIVVDLDQDDEANTGPCWYEVVEVISDNSKPTALRNDENVKEVRVIALFSTKKEAAECARIKESFRGRGKQNEQLESSFLVRRRWNV
ncbi:hypothetical protein HJC23_011966 [Cyclotella cryptica]|uniref:Uncharacterized protein n=1 Tax=Cyclotella cryptica TaxID=29204 RepID=A0ABD3QRB7_9STRA|eukprot:CCRYP_003017-RA/>CCRYP_003017-RA protein AED:0.00 eAED:0.00 QI:540/-1/1/1/-1/1/1/35/415